MSLVCKQRLVVQLCLLVSCIQQARQGGGDAGGKATSPVRAGELAEKRFSASCSSMSPCSRAAQYSVRPPTDPAKRCPLVAALTPTGAAASAAPLRFHFRRLAEGMVQLSLEEQRRHQHRREGTRPHAHRADSVNHLCARPSAWTTQQCQVTPASPSTHRCHPHAPQHTGVPSVVSFDGPLVMS